MAPTIIFIMFLILKDFDPSCLSIVLRITTNTAGGNLVKFRGRFEGPFWIVRSIRMTVDVKSFVRGLNIDPFGAGIRASPFQILPPDQDTVG